MKAMILAAGEGTRLRPLTLTVPKPMVPIVGVPLLARTLDWLARQGVAEAAINLYHRPQAIPDYFGDEWHGVRLHYFFEETLRGTAGGVKGAEAVLSDGPFYVIYGDNLIHADLRRLARFHQSHGGAATVALFSHPNPTAAGIVGLDQTGRITRFVEKPQAEDVFSDRANAGVYVLEASIFAHIPAAGASDFGKDIFPAMLAGGQPLYGAMLGGYLQDTGTPDSYRQANFDVLLGKTGAPSDNKMWGADSAHVESTAKLDGFNVFDDGVVVEREARLTDCILWRGARVGVGATLRRAILGPGARVAAGASAPIGLILGENEYFG